MSDEKIKEANRIIDELGGTNATAELCEVEPPSVSDWRKYGIPRARRLFLKAIRPDLFRSAERRKSAA